jgi:glucuronate isomerase
MTSLAPHPDRLLPVDRTTRDIARRIYGEVANKPIISPHGHVDARLLLEDKPFSDPSALLITPDHYLTRMLHSAGVPLSALGVRNPDADGREIWRLFCEHWDRFLGTPVRFWLESELHDVFGVNEQPSLDSADRIYDLLDDALARPEFRPRALFDQFSIEVLATTDDPTADLSAHEALRDDPSFTGRVLPTFRADRFMDPAVPIWRSALTELSACTGIDCGSYAGLLTALRQRRQAFIAAGATATDSGVPDAGCEPLSDLHAEALHRAALTGSLSAADAVRYRQNMLYRFAEMSVDDGLVMQLHPGVIRNHHTPTLEQYGPDTGHDLPDTSYFTRPLTPILRDFGTNPSFRLVLFSVDESTFAREIGPLAGFYPSVYVGAPWWFLDTPAAIMRFREAVTDSAGFYKSSGFIDDTRAFCSIPARHDMSRRVDAAYLAERVARHEFDEDTAIRLALHFVDKAPRDTFRLG